MLLTLLMCSFLILQISIDSGKQEPLTANWHIVYQIILKNSTHLLHEDLRTYEWQKPPNEINNPPYNVVKEDPV